MRTTLNLDADILHAAKQIAERRGEPLGAVVSDLVRLALVPRRAPKVRNGVILFKPVGGAPAVTLEMVNRLRDEV